MRKIKYIAIHNNGYAGKTIDNIRRSHVKGNGWSDIGYHWVLHENGAWLKGRPEHRAGAGIEGLNKHALHLCVVGNFNKTEMSITQSTALFFKLLELQTAHPDARIIGHREGNEYLPKRLRTRKSCPGKLVNMDVIRNTVAEAMRA